MGNLVFQQALIREEDWDAIKELPRNIYIKKNKILAYQLENIKIELNSFLSNSQRHTKNTINIALKKIFSIKEIIYPENSLVHFTNEYISSKIGSIEKSTYNRYKVFLNLICRFEGYLMKRLLIEDINSFFLKNFSEFGEEQHYSKSTIYRTINFIKTILNFAEEKGVTTSVKQLNIGRQTHDKELVILSLKEINEIYITKVPNDFKTSKNWLLISCYTGQRVSDFMKFTTRDLISINEKLCIKFFQKKTKKKIVMPLHPMVIEILNDNNNKFPQPIGLNTYNTQIKQIAKLAGITEIITTNKRYGHRVQKVTIPKWEAITSHIGRRSFATNFYGKIPTPLLMDVTGHSTEKMFLNYINPINNDRIVSLSNYFDELHKSD